jgi:hypothetical protein
MSSLLIFIDILPNEPTVSEARGVGQAHMAPASSVRPPKKRQVRLAVPADFQSALNEKEPERRFPVKRQQRRILRNFDRIQNSILHIRWLGEIHNAIGKYRGHFR